MFPKIVALLAVSLFAVRASVITSRLRQSTVDNQIDNQIDSIISQLQTVESEFDANNQTLASLTT